jgi:hypothetical protein
MFANLNFNEPITHQGLSNEIKSASPIALKIYRTFSDENTKKCKEF